MSAGNPRFEPVPGSITVAAAVVRDPDAGGLTAAALLVSPGATSGLVPGAGAVPPPVGNGGSGGSETFTRCLWR